MPIFVLIFLLAFTSLNSVYSLSCYQCTQLNSDFCQGVDIDYQQIIIDPKGAVRKNGIQNYVNQDCPADTLGCYWGLNIPGKPAVYTRA